MDVRAYFLWLTEMPSELFGRSPSEFGQFTITLLMTINITTIAILSNHHQHIGHHHDYHCNTPHHSLPQFTIIIMFRWVDGELIVREGREEEGWKELENLLDRNRQHLEL